MRFTKYARTEVMLGLLAVAGDLTIVTVLAWFDLWIIAGVLLVLTVLVDGWFLSFFRDPVRPADVETLKPNVMYAPADGKVTDISECDDDRVGGRALRIGIFLSIFNVHINRAPCRCRVVNIQRRQGRYLNAMKAESGTENTCVDLELAPIMPGRVNVPQRVVVRQISGLIARRIVCDTQVDAELGTGEQFGIIKFGSRTELIVPADGSGRVLVEVGQSVKAGDDAMIEY